jgi:type II secretion system protein C
LPNARDILDRLKRSTIGRTLMSPAFTMRAGAAVLIAYVLAGSISAFCANMFGKMAIEAFKFTPQTTAQFASINVQGPPINYMKLEKAVVERNIFNSEGKVPDESMEEAAGPGKPAKFDINAACQKATVEIDLLGTIYLGEGPTSGSLATVMEKGYTEADVYRVGDTIVGYDDVLVAKIDPGRLVLNNAGKKECLELAGPKLPQFASGSDEVPVGSMPGAGGAKPPPPAASGGEVVLEATFVEQQIGQGGGNILNQGRLVPFNQDGVMKGFKLISLKSGGLFDKIGLKNNDVVTQVNDTSLLQPDQGFAFYQAFESETDIRVSVLRNDQPMTFSVKVK